MVAEKTKYVIPVAENVQIDITTKAKMRRNDRDSIVRHAKAVTAVNSKVRNHNQKSEVSKIMITNAAELIKTKAEYSSPARESKIPHEASENRGKVRLSKLNFRKTDLSNPNTQRNWG